MAANRKRTYRMERPDSMKGKIDKEATHRRLGPAQRDVIRKALPKDLDNEGDFGHGIDVAAEWIDRYLKSDARGEKPPPTFSEQKASRHAIRAAIKDLNSALADADRETKKRIYHYFADEVVGGLSGETWHEDSFDIGKNAFNESRRKLNKRLTVLLTAVKASKREDDPRGQVDPRTYLFYQLVLIWQHLTGSAFTVSTSSDRGTPLAFYNTVLTATAETAITSAERKTLRGLATWSTGRTFIRKQSHSVAKVNPQTQAMNAVFRKLTRGHKHRGEQDEKEHGRSDSDQDRP